MEKNSIKYTAFKIENKKYEFLRMPFGLSNAPMTFQNTMEGLFKSIEGVLIYLDEILIHTKDINTHYKTLKKVLSIIRDNGISINFDKCNFLKIETKFLGHVIKKEGIRPDISRTLTLEKIKSKKKRDVQRMLRFINWYRAFLSNISARCNFLTEKAKKDIKFSWTETDQKKLDEKLEDIKRCSALYFPDKNKTFVLETDASDSEFGDRLTQDNKVFVFYSHKLSKTEFNYTVIENKIMSIVNSLRHFRYLIWNSKIIIRTDNKDLISRKDLSSRAQRWKLQLEEYNYEFEFIPRKNNYNADLLSRLCFINCNKLKFNIEKLYKFTNTRPEKSRDGTENFIKKIVIPNDKDKSILKNIHKSLINPE
ncbi:Retrovirus-related Pol polyprotein from transposon 17.6 [Dictyocoela muelleri]|nr:Retrovirus-related Pol polyprotein from transposon 17.6 [Dictyocoela muelleri]